MRKRSHDKLNASDADDARIAIEQAILRLLEPIARLVREAGFSAADLYVLYEMAAVRYEAAFLERNGNAKSISEISASTGISRNNVSRILKLPTDLRSKPKTKSRQPVGNILRAWRKNAKFKNNSGHPAALNLYGKGTSFDLLVKNHGSGIPTRAALDALANAEMIEITEGDVICLKNRTVRSRIETDHKRLQLFVERLWRVMTWSVESIVSPRDAHLFVGEYQMPLFSSAVRDIRDDLLAGGFSLNVDEGMDARNKLAGESSLRNKTTECSLTLFCQRNQNDSAKPTNARKKRLNYKRG